MNHTVESFMKLYYIADFFHPITYLSFHYRLEFLNKHAASFSLRKHRFDFLLSALDAHPKHEKAKAGNNPNKS